MPLNTPEIDRHQLHRRSIEVEGFFRQDGMYDIEGTVRDVKTSSFSNLLRGRIAAGEAIHDMSIRMTIDSSYTLREIEAVTDSAPYPTICPLIVGAFQSLVGLKLGPGWNAAVREKVGGIKGCTHLVELLQPLATTAYITMWLHQKHELGTEKIDTQTPPSFIDGCHALARDSRAVEIEYPDFYEDDS